MLRASGLVLTACLLLAAASSGCERERRPLRVEPPVSDRPRADDARTDGRRRTGESWRLDYEENAYAIAEGKRLYSYFNCNGCHAHGGGDIGPPLMDSLWIYGGEPSEIYTTIVEGRPNGMPSFGARIPRYQVWQLVAYVRSMSGAVPFDAAPGRNDDMFPGPPENAREGRVSPGPSARIRAGEASG